MKSFLSLVVAGVLCLAGAAVQAEGVRSPFESLRPEAAPKASAELDLDGLKEMLTEMGIKAEKVDLGSSRALVLTVNHPYGKRTHILGIHGESKNIIVMCAEPTSDASKASTEWYRKVAKVNTMLHPRSVFLSGDKVAMASLLGNANVTNKELMEFLAKHVIACESVLIPLVKELDEVEAPAPF